MACNKPKCGEKNPCKKCTQDIVVESCDKLCPFILESDCVTISRDIECAGIIEGETVTEALEKLCDLSSCPCPKGQYTINTISVVDVKCQVGLGDQVTILLNLTPNFDLTTPTFLNVFLQGEQNTNTYKANFNVFSEFIPTIQSGVVFNSLVTLVIPNTFTGGNYGECAEGYLVSVLDNEGNTSNEVCLSVLDIQNVQDCNTP